MSARLTLEPGIDSAADITIPTPRHWKKRSPQDAAQRYNGFRFAIPDYKAAPDVDDIFELQREEEQRRKNSIEYRLESYLEMWDVVVCIEHCHNCDNHGSSLRHNAAKYVDQSIVFHKLICKILHNSGFSIRVGVVRLHLTNESRIGAFEIDIYCRSRVSYVHSVLHSKLLSLQWPTKRSVETELLSFLNKLNLPRWKDTAGSPLPPPANILSDDISYPIEYGMWEEYAPALPSWSCPAQDVIGELSMGPDSPIQVEWIYDNRQSQPFYPVIGGYCRVSGLSTPAGGLERLSLLAYVTETQASSPNYPNEDCVKIKLKYVGTEHVVPISACCEIGEYTPLRPDYGPEEFPEELALVLLFLMSSRKKLARLNRGYDEKKASFDNNLTSPISDTLHLISSEIRNTTGKGEDISKAQRSPRGSPRPSPRSPREATPPNARQPAHQTRVFFPDLDPIEMNNSAATAYHTPLKSSSRLVVTDQSSSTSTTFQTEFDEEWVALSENDKVVFEKVFLCRASLFIQLREKVSHLERIVLTDSNIAGTIYHPISGNFVDLQQAYSEESLNWLFSRYSIADIYQLEDIVERLYLMAVDEFVNCMLDQVAPKYAYKLQCFLLRHCIRDRWQLICNSNYYYRKLVDNISSLSVEDLLLLTTKFVRSTMRELCEFMAALRQRSEDWLSRVPYLIGALDGRAVGSITKADICQALSFLNVPDRVLNDEYLNAIFLSIDVCGMGDVSVSQLQNFLECDNNFKRELCNLRGDIKSHLNAFVTADFSNTDESNDDAPSTRNVVLCDLFCDTLYKLALSNISTSQSLQVGWQYDKNYFITAETFLRLLRHFGFDSFCTGGDLRLLLWTYSQDNKRMLFVNISEVNRQDEKIVCWLNFLTWIHWHDSEPYAAVSHRLVARAVLLWNKDISANSQRLVLQWTNPDDITYGTPLTEKQLNARAETSRITGVSSLSSIEGSYRYTPGLGEVLDAGQHVLRAVFVPADLSKYQIAEKTVVVNVIRLIPTLVWDELDEIVCGEELVDKYLNCQCMEGISGLYYYSKTFGHIFRDPGLYEIVCTFIPDNSNYAKVSKTNMIKVVPPDTGKKDATIVWDDGEEVEIRVGEELTEKHLRARVVDENAQGSFFYSRSHSHTFLKPGEFELIATFVPHESSSKHLRRSSKSVFIRVLEPKIKTQIVWDDLQDITYGAPLNERHFSCYAVDITNQDSVDGKFEFSNEEGDVLDAGTHVITANFYPRNLDRYECCEKSVTLVVRPAEPRLVWEEPPKREITVEDELSDALLTAYCRDAIEGTVVYNYSFGHSFDKPGEYVIEATFIPANTQNYKRVSKQMTIRVLNARPIAARIFCESYISLDYGDVLYEELLNCRLVVELSDQQIDGQFVFSPPLEDIQSRAGDYALFVNFVPIEKCLRMDIATASIEVHISKADPIIEWDDYLSSLFVGDTLTESHLNATCAAMSGQFFYSKPVGTIMTLVGMQEITCTFVPSDPFDTNYKRVTKTAFIEVHAGSDDFALHWADPLPIEYGIALSSAHLNPIVIDKYSKEVRAGSYEFVPSEGSVLDAGRHTLSVTYTATPTDDDALRGLVHSQISKTVKITVNKAVPVIAWADKLGDIAVGTPLDGEQYLNAKCLNAEGSFVYSIPAGHVFSVAGEVQIIANFTPSQLYLSNFQLCSKSALLSVVPKIDTSIEVYWGKVDTIVYGTALTEQLYDVQICNKSTKEPIEGSVSFEPPIGAILNAGMHTLTVTFQPVDLEKYSTVTKTQPITVNKAVPELVWEEPTENMVVGEELCEKQLNAKCLTEGLKGTFFYSHSMGQHFSVAGLYRISATFVPSPPQDSNYIVNASKSVFVTVNDVEEVETEIRWPAPAPINYGIPINHIQLNAQVVSLKTGEFLSGNAVYEPPPGVILPAGKHELTVTFKHSDFITYPNTLMSSTNLIVNKAQPTLKWRPSLTPLVTGQPLTLDHVRIDVKEGIQGRFMFDPPLGHVFAEGGIHPIAVLFFPDSYHDNNYRQGSVTVKLPVLEHAKGNSSVMAELIWHTPKDMFLGSTLTEEQLNAMCVDRDNAAVVEGSFTYTPPLGTSLLEGNHTIRVIFTPHNKKKYGEIYSSEVTVKVIDKSRLPHLNQAKPVKDAVRTKTGYISVAKTNACRTMVFHRMVLNSKVLKKSKFGDMEVSMRVSSHELSPVEMLDIVDRVNGTVNFYCQSKFLDLTTEEFLNTHLVISLRGHSIITKKRVEYYCSVSVPLVEFMTVNEGPFTISLVAHPKLYFPDNGLTMRTDTINEQCKMQIAIVAHAYEPVSVESDQVRSSKEASKSAAVERPKSATKGKQTATKSPKPTKKSAAAAIGANSPSKDLSSPRDASKSMGLSQAHYGSMRKQAGTASAPIISKHSASTPMSLYPFEGEQIDYNEGNETANDMIGRDLGFTTKSATSLLQNTSNIKPKTERRRERPDSAPVRGKRLDFRDVSVPFNAAFDSKPLSAFGNDL